MTCFNVLTWTLTTTNCDLHHFAEIGEAQGGDTPGLTEPDEFTDVILLVEGKKLFTVKGNIRFCWVFLILVEDFY